ncbi:MAG: glycosyltransferase family 39 protein [Spirochaetes bacterium]|nr:glycosyltransferase family 39 protein [Spirochaetota bacterium]
MKIISLSGARKNIQLLVILSVFILGNIIGINSTSNYQADESYYIYSAMRMNETGNWLVPYYEDNVARFQKPILFYWFVGLVYKIAGFGIAQARLISLFIALLNLILVYKFTRLLFNNAKVSLYSVLILSSNFMYLIYSKVAATDIALFFFMNLAVYFLYKGYKHGSRNNLISGYLFSGLAVATKGPLGLLIPFSAIVIFLFYNEGLQGVKKVISFPGILLFLISALFWPLLMYIKFGSAFTGHFINAEVKSRVAYSIVTQLKNLIYYIHTFLRYAHIWIILLGIRLFSRKRSWEITLNKEKGSLLLIWILSVLLLFSLFITMHRSRYILPLFFPLSVLTAVYLQDISSRAIKIISLSAFLLFVTVNGFLPTILKPEAIKPLCRKIKDNSRKIIAVGVPQRSRVWIRLFAGRDADHVMDDPDGLIRIRDEKLYLIIEKDLWIQTSPDLKIKGHIIGESYYNFKKKFRDKYFWHSFIKGIKKGMLKKEMRSLINKHRLWFLLVEIG